MKIAFEIDQESFDRMSIIWPGGVVPGAYDVLCSHVTSFGQTMERVAYLRELGAISGAMRWPWSQEFCINQPLPPAG